MLAEEVRKGLIINDLPLKNGDINKLFVKKKKSNSKNFNSSQSGIDFDSFNEFSPLKIMGYAVGHSGLELDKRERVLQLSILGISSDICPTVSIMTDRGAHQVQNNDLVPFIHISEGSKT